MKERDIHSYASHLFEMMGDKAEVYAAQQLAAFDKSLDTDSSRSMRRDWRRIREAIMIMKMTHSRFTHH
ncbi:hypothetical protein QGN29_03380 [Temperatibacter marinus]|uniref:Uncharacterized protein n=1 Tax=Temperatibacter marinus TaxID=1456591 RepID=A0AA52H9P6_9PROT|nr:hypothetical protein [Temperatibacter marinus]WND03411.1 hypothetical protein QGN29_03380 [Temperatibacter marinus]